MNNQCQRGTCKHPAVRGGKYCYNCKDSVLFELREAGYLETGGDARRGQNRSGGAKEDQRETKYGTD